MYSDEAMLLAVAITAFKSDLFVETHWPDFQMLQIATVRCSYFRNLHVIRKPRVYLLL